MAAELKGTDVAAVVPRGASESHSWAFIRAGKQTERKKVEGETIWRERGGGGGGAHIRL